LNDYVKLYSKDLYSRNVFDPFIKVYIRRHHIFINRRISDQYYVIFGHYPTLYQILEISHGVRQIIYRIQIEYSIKRSVIETYQMIKNRPFNRRDFCRNHK